MELTALLDNAKVQDAAEERTRIGNTPTCEDCDQPQDACICEDGILLPSL